jgi:hypothetical protein
MALMDEMLESGKHKMSQLKTWVEELDVQLALGKAEAKDALERERKNLSLYMQEQKKRMRDAEERFEESKTALIEKFDQLEERLSKDMGESKEEFEAQKRDTLEVIYALEQEIKDQYGEMADDMQDQLDHFKTKLDGYRVQLALGKYEMEDALEEKKSDIRNAVASVRERMHKETPDKLEIISDELGVAADHLKKALKELFT